MQDYLLSIGLALSVYFLYRKFSFTMNKNVNNVSGEEAYQLIKDNKDLVILDVRTKQEYSSGHIVKAKNIPIAEFSSRINELQKYKDTPILVHCASGGRSPSAVRVLLKHQFKNINHMKQGLRDWQYGLK